MAPMRWDNELAENAKYNVRHCLLEHDKCRNTPKFRFAGQNMALMTFSEPHNMSEIMTWATRGWFRQYKKGSMAIIKCYPENLDGP